MKLSPSVLDLDWPEVEKRIRRFIKEYVENSGVEGIVVGLSGGIDSSTTAALSSLAIGGGKVLGLLLPEKETYNPKDVEDAKFVAKKFGLQTQVCDITPALEAIYNTIPIFDSAEKLCKGNIKARTRMIYLYYYANKLNRIVCGSSDKSETMMGYFTKWGDVAADISPIMDLYKTQVRKLAVYLGFPAELAAKPSTPALWPNQFAETELGVKYETLDLILYGLEHFMTIEDIAQQLSIDKSLVEKVKSRWLSTEHKRRVLLTPKLEYRTVGTDFRLPRNTY
ncbi:MAG: NAD+ synthase [Candidatus Bathyarchaeota archaeon]|nr:NAD+ synthase [Candidatus Bathyarchaeota archaeon]